MKYKRKKRRGKNSYKKALEAHKKRSSACGKKKEAVADSATSGNVLDSDSGKPLSSSPYLVSDMDTGLESFLTMAGLLLILASLQYWSTIRTSVDVGGAGTTLRWMLLASVFCLLLRFAVGCAYILDRKRKQVLYGRTIGVYSQVFKICDFADVEKVQVRSFYTQDKNASFFKNRKYHHSVCLSLKGVGFVPISDFSSDINDINKEAHKLARFLCKKYVPGSLASASSYGGGCTYGEPFLKPVDHREQTAVRIPMLIDDPGLHWMFPLVLLVVSVGLLIRALSVV